MSQITDLTLAQLKQALDDGDLSSVEITTAFLDRIDSLNPELNAFITITHEDARKAAADADAARAKGKASAFAGLPIAHKDLFCTDGTRTTCGSKMLADFVAPYDAHVVSRCQQAGLISLGKLNMDEFAMVSSNETSRFGPPSNPWRRAGSNATLTAGGSSGGSATAVAADICLAATASDTGGSIRQPAAFTGTVGIKPTYGRASRYGMVAFASSLDQAGPIAKTVTDAALLTEIMCSHDDKDSTSLKVDTPDWVSEVHKGVKGMKIGVPKEYRVDGMPEEIEKLWQQGIDWLKAMGAEIVDVSLPHTKYALPAYYIVAPAEASSNLARYDGMRYGARQDGDGLIGTYEDTRADGFGAEVQRRLMIGTYVLSSGYYDAYYLRAQKVRTRILQDFETVFEEVDALLTPTCPSAAFAYGEKTDDPVQMYLNDIFTVTANLAGLPGISVPAGTDNDGLPLGLQVIGKALDEAACFRVAGAIEDAAGFTAKPEKWW